MTALARGLRIAGVGVVIVLALVAILSALGAELPRSPGVMSDSLGPENGERIDAYLARASASLATVDGGDRGEGGDGDDDAFDDDDDEAPADAPRWALVTAGWAWTVPEAVAWPTEPIGVGARWTVTRAVDDAVAPTRVVTYRLTALDGDVATVSLEMTAPEPAATLDAPAADGGPGVTLAVDAYEVTGSGELTVDLRAALPVEGTTESST